MADIYIDPDAGSDSTGDGQIGSPYKSLQGAIDDVAGWHTSSGASNTFYMANTVADTVTSTISPGALAGLDVGFALDVYDAGGSLTLTDGGGNTVDCFHMQGDGVTHIINQSYTSIRNGKFSATGSGISQHAVRLGSNGTIVTCEAFGANVRQIDASNSHVFNCHCHLSGGSGTGSMGVSMAGSGSITGCNIADVDRGIYAAGAGVFVAYNTVSAVNECINCIQNTVMITNNDLSDATNGIEIESSGQGTSILNNRFYDIGTSLIYQGAGTAPLHLVGNNYTNSGSFSVSNVGIPIAAATTATDSNVIFFVGGTIGNTGYFGESSGGETAHVFAC